MAKTTKKQAPIRTRATKKVEPKKLTLLECVTQLKSAAVADKKYELAALTSEIEKHLEKPELQKDWLFESVKKVFAVSQCQEWKFFFEEQVKVGAEKHGFEVAKIEVEKPKTPIDGIGTPVYSKEDYEKALNKAAIRDAEINRKERKRKHKELTAQFTAALLSNPKLYFNYQFTFWQKVRKLVGLKANVAVNKPSIDEVLITSREYADKILDI